MKVGILGATGAVGRQMLASIEERNIEVDEIRLFASLKSAGKKFAYNMNIDLDFNDDNGGIYNGYINTTNTTSGEEFYFFRELN